MNVDDEMYHGCKRIDKEVKNGTSNKGEKTKEF